MSTGGVKVFFRNFFHARPWAPAVPRPGAPAVPTVTNRSAFQALVVAAFGRVGSVFVMRGAFQALEVAA